MISPIAFDLTQLFDETPFLVLGLLDTPVEEIHDTFDIQWINYTRRTNRQKITSIAYLDTAFDPWEKFK